MAELFNEKYVHFMWHDELEGKKVFTANDMENLIKGVNSNASRHEVSHTISNSNTSEYDLQVPFRSDTMLVYQFVYYDPLYEYKKAYNEGKTVQIKDHIHNDWVDIKYENVLWGETAETGTYRLKPEEVYYVHKICDGYIFDTLPCDFHFYGTREECQKWIDEHKSKYRPYKDCEEMKRDFDKRLMELIGLERVENPMSSPLIWVKRKEYGTEFLVTAFDNSKYLGTERLPCVNIQDTWVNFEELFEGYTYLDGSPIGKEE